jgi:hypothetical protein
MNEIITKIHPFRSNMEKILSRGAACPIVTGLHAPKGTGKDTTVAGLIAAAQRLQVAPPKQTYFAEPLYRAVSVFTGSPVEWLQDQRNKNTPYDASTTSVRTLWGKTPRWILEQFGTQFVRNQIGASHWLELAAQRINENRGDYPWHIITDVRFVNEAQFCDGVIELRREGIEYGGPGDHESSRRLPDEHIAKTIWLGEPSDEYYEDLLLEFAQFAVERS